MKRQNIPLPSNLVQWANDNTVEHYLGLYLGLLHLGPDGAVHFSEVIEHDIYLKILSHNIHVPDTVPSQIKQELIGASVFRLKKHRQKHSSSNFRITLAAHVFRYLNSPKEQFAIMLPLHTASNSLDGFNLFRILDTTLLVRNWVYLQKRFEIQKFFEALAIHFKFHNIEDINIAGENFVPLLVLVQGNNRLEAAETAVRAFDLFRCLLNIQSSFGRFHYRYGGYPKPIGPSLPPPAIGVFKPTGEYIDYYFHMSRDLQYSLIKVSRDQVIKARKLANRLRPPKDNNDTTQILIEALEKYGQALEASEWRLAFLLLWQILELVTLQSSEQFNMKNVISRLNGLFQQNRQMKDLLDGLYETRNLLVHKGAFPDREGLEEINLLKYIAERAIDALLFWRDTFPTTTELGYFYDHLAQNNSELARRQRAIEAILKRRAK